MSTPLNPLPPDDAQLRAGLPAELAPNQPSAGPVAGMEENPSWTFWDVVLLAAIFFVLINVMVGAAIALIGTAHLFGYDLTQLTRDRNALDKFAHDPRVILPVQLLAYLFLLLMMAVLVRIRERVPQGFFQSVGWRWPGVGWPAFAMAGAVLAIVVQLASAWLPIPPSLPIEKYFQTPTYAYLMAGFGILVAPFIEELFFRGFLYPALARALGVVAGVVLTSLAFMLVHGSQLGFSWAAMLMLFIVGLVLTIVRARTKSLAASVLVHLAYNTTLFVSFFISSDGFKHLEKMQ